MNRYLRYVVLLIVSAFILASCSSGGGGEPVAAAGGGTTVSNGTTTGIVTIQVAPDMSAVLESMAPAERKAALDKVNLAWGNINKGSLDADNQALVAYIRTLPEFADAGVAEDKTVWARFKDGYPVNFVTKIVPPGTVLPAAGAGAGTGRAAMRAPIPQGDKAVLIDVDLLAEGSLATIEPALQKKAYVPSRLRGTVADFMSIKNVSVLFISSHGGSVMTKPGTQSYGVMTSEKIAPFDPLNANATSLSAMYRAGELAMSGVRVRDTNGVQISVPGSFWTITELFVKNNWAFTGNSLVVLDTCELYLDATLTKAADKAVYQNFRARLAGAGASAILGWDGQVSPGFASDVMQLFFDRVLGANAYLPENPPQRPFPYVEVRDWLASKGKAREAGGGGLNLQGTGQLVPTIQRAVVYTPASGALYAGKWILELSGEFGVEAGTVTVNGNDRPWLEWKEHSIIAELPAAMDSPGSSGDILVTVRDHKSNALPLTQWVGTISQSQSNTEIGSGATVNVTCPVRMTSDVHFNRNIPGDTPQFISVMVLEVPGPCTYSLSGTWSITTTNYELTGSGSAAPLALSKIYGSLLYTGGALALPVDHSGGLMPMITLQGNLKKTDTSTNPVTVRNEQVFASWAYAQTGVNTTGVSLGADYKFSASRSCIGMAGTKPTVCTETWNAPALFLTMPNATTQL